MYKGKNTIIVLPKFQIDGMVEIMDYFMAHPLTTAEKVKKKFDLNEDEYQMIYDLCMPHERVRNHERYWIAMYKGVIGAIEMLIAIADSKNQKTVRIDNLREIVKKHSVGKQNAEKLDDFDACDLSEGTEEEEDDE